MFPKEKDIIIDQLNQIKDIGPRVLNVGCGTLEYVHKQSYISDLYGFLESNSLALFSLDINPKTNATYIYDITSDDLSQKLIEFDLVLCTNVLEHVVPKRFMEAVQNLQKIVKLKGCLVVTVPYNLPLHPCPIDNGYRPTAEELEELFPNFKPAMSAMWEDHHYRDPFISSQTKNPIISGNVLIKSKN